METLLEEALKKNVCLRNLGSQFINGRSLAKILRKDSNYKGERLVDLVPQIEIPKDLTIQHRALEGHPEYQNILVSLAIVRTQKFIPDLIRNLLLLPYQIELKQRILALKQRQF